MFAASKSGKAAAGGPGPTDPSFAYVPLLLNTGSTNGQQNNTFLDSSTNNFTITRNGTPTQGSITPYWPNGQWSNYFATTSDYLSTPNVSALQPGSSTTAFSIECWIYPTASGVGDRAIFGNYKIISYPTNSDGLDFLYLNTGSVVFRWGYPNYAESSLSSVIQVNTWNHVVVCRNTSGSMSCYLNGTRFFNTSSNTNITNSTASSFWVGWAGSISGTTVNPFPGYISNFKFLKNATDYDPTQTTISVPTTPPTSDANTSLLTCQSNRFIDVSGTPKTITPNGTPTVQAFQPFSPAASYTTALYGGSGYFNGSTDYLTTPSNAAFAIGAGDFTIEGWVYTTAALTTNVLFAVAINDGLTLYVTGGNLIVRSFDTADLLSSSTIPTLNAWTHIAATRSGTSLRIFVNGVQTATTTNSTNFPQGQAVVGAGSLVGAAPWVGYVSNFRLVKGTAVYTANFTPPTAPVTAITNTSLLLNMTNAGIYDAAAQNNAITVGDAQASTTITAQWPPTSMKFDGTGDWLTAIDNPQLQLGTGNFTIEGWVYLSAIGVVYGVLSKGTATTGWSVNITVLNRLQFSYTASNLTGTTTLATGTWYYFAVVRSGSATGNLKLYLNGSLEATSGGAVTDNFNQTDILYVGASRTGTTPLNGYLEDIRITKAARTITASPTAAFPTR